MAVSKSQADKAGAILRRWWQSTEPATDEIQTAITVVWQYRALFGYPTTKVNANLRHYVRKTGAELVTQRWKRLPRMADKLVRHPNMRLSQMQDVGGCRAILPDQNAVNSVLTGLRRNWDIITVDDYVATPQITGYRAIHVMVRKDNLPVEVQLRTVGQQDWADEIERIDGLLPGWSLKDGDGPDDVVAYTKLLATVIASQEAGHPSDSATLQELNRLSRLVP
ncbi:MAG: RelA/SpoT domain-containing protein [Acidimicrobiales bacterium]